MTRWIVFGFRVLKSQFEGHLGELEAGAIRRGEGEVTARFRLDRAENIGCAAALVFVVAPCFAPRFGRRGGTNVGVQRDRLLIQADYRFLRIVRLFVDFQNVFHLGDVVFIEFGHAPHFFPATA